MDSNPAEATVEEGRGGQGTVGMRKRARRASSAAPRRVTATTGTRAAATKTGTPVEEVCADDVDLTSLPSEHSERAEPSERSEQAERVKRASEASKASEPSE